MKEASYHLTLLAKNRTGFQNLVKLSSVAFLEGFYYKPRIDKELLEAHNEGLICLSGCVSGESVESAPGRPDGRGRAAWRPGISDVFGDRYFIEIQNSGLEIQRLCAEGTIDLARRMGLPLVATSDAHYVNREDAEAQDVLLVRQHGRFRTDTNRMRMEGDQFFVRTPGRDVRGVPRPGRRRRHHAGDRRPRRHRSRPGRRGTFPSSRRPPGRPTPNTCASCARSGCPTRYDEVTPEHHRERLDHELGVIDKLGFANYFLIVWDFVRFARRERRFPPGARFGRAARWSPTSWV